MTTAVTLVAEPPVARIQLAGQGGIQLLGPQTRRRLNEVLDELLARADISVVVIESSGRTFIAGADISELRSLDKQTAYENSRAGQMLMSRIAALPMTTIAAIHAACAGGGTELSLACDLRLAAAGAVIGLPETRIGVVPGWGGTVRATRLLGGPVARRLILTGELVPAAIALQLGLVDEVAADDAFRNAIDRRIELLLGRGPSARSQAKRLIASFEGAADEALFESEARAFADCYDTAEPEIGMRAFLEKHTAVWPDRLARP